MRRAGAIALVLLLALAAPAAAKESFNDLEDELMCVNCNVALNIAEAPQAEQERALLRRLVDQGLSKQQIKDRMVEVYGPNVLAEPEGDGFDLFAWLVPIGAALALVALGLTLLPRWRRRHRDDDDDGPAGPPLDPADAARVDADMARLGV
ncbi:MAG TPA: cytochrome c-type biogenesis protein CcmH [Solirubrobacteraceae bacterium]